MAETEREDLWRQYDVHIDLYKFHIEMTVKYNVLSFGIAGGVASYAFSHAGEVAGLAKFGLLLPILFSICFACAMTYCTFVVQSRKADLLQLKENLKISTAPNLTLLQAITAAFAVVHSFIAIGLSVALFRH